MYKIRIAKFNPFWSRNNENKPSKEIFEKWKEDNLVDIEIGKITINFENLERIIIHTAFNDIKYIEIKNIDDTNDTRYYYLDSISRVGSNNTFECICLIDIYCSYTINFIEQNKNNEFNFLRQHEYDKQALQINDDLIESVPKLYKNFYFNKNLFNYDSTNNIWYGENIGISGRDLLNANKYYIFKDGVDGGYKYFPVLSKALNVKVYYAEQVRGKVIKEEYFWNGRYRNYVDDIDSLKQEIDPTLNDAITKAYNDNNIVKYYYRKPVGTGYSDWIEIPNTPYGTLPVDVSVTTHWYNYAGAGIRRLKIWVYVLGNEVYYKESGNYVAWEFDEGTKQCSNLRQLKVVIYQNEPKATSRTFRNSITSLEEYRRKEENINKFLGIYYLPHFLNFKKFDTDGNYLFINIKPSGDMINYFKIYDYKMSNIIDKYNNTTYSTPYLLKYAMVKYFGNKINAEYRVNEQNSIYIGGKIFFTDTCSIISKSDQLISLDNSVITYPYQLPLGVSSYEQYVKANRGVTDTGFAVAKQQQDLNFAKSIFGGVMGLGGTIMKGVTSGNIVGSVASGINDVANLGFNIAGQMQSMKHQEMQIQAQYRQAKLTMGNEMKFSNITTASLTEYYDSNNGEQYEGVEISDLNKSSLAMINNFILLYGYMVPNKKTLREKIDNNRKFNFIQIDNLLINQTLNLNYNEKQWNNQIYAYIVEQLSSGIRIWNSQDISIPEYNDNEEWPDTPTRPPVEPPKPPLPENPEDGYIIDKLGLGSKIAWYDKRGELQLYQIAMITQDLTNAILNKNEKVLVIPTNNEPYINTFEIDKISKFILTITGEYDAEIYDKLEYIINQNDNVSTELDELVINVKNQQVYDKLKSLPTLKDSGDSKFDRFVEQDLREINIKKITINKV